MRKGGGEVRTGEADIHDINELAQRRFLRCFIEQQLKILQP